MTRTATFLAALFAGSLVASAPACNKTPPPPRAELRASDAGVELVAGARTLALPAGDVPQPGQAIWQNDKGSAFGVQTQRGLRSAYVIGDKLWLGPAILQRGDVAPPLEEALGGIFEEAGDRRMELAAAVKSSLGEAGLVRLLVEAAYVEAKEWDALFTSLAEPQKAEVLKGLALIVDRGQPERALERAVAKAPLTDVKRLEARVRALMASGVQLRAAAVILRAITKLDAPLAARIGCEAIATKPTTEPPHRELFVEAALLAIASEASKGVACLPAVVAALTEEPCKAYFRCAAGAPLTPSQTTLQDEPVCTKEELAPVLARELTRTPSEVMNGYARGPLFAYAALAAQDKVPEAFTQAHARRRFALTQPKEPACDSGVGIGTPCRCDEAQIRDLACRNLGASSAHVGLCKFEVDEKQNKILNVTAAMGP